MTSTAAVPSQQTVRRDCILEVEYFQRLPIGPRVQGDTQPPGEKDKGFSSKIVLCVKKQKKKTIKTERWCALHKAGI